MMVLGLLAARCVGDDDGIGELRHALEAAEGRNLLSAMADLSSLNERKGAGRVISAPQRGSC